MAKNSELGKFVISLDTELAWGSFDTGSLEEHKPAYRKTRTVISSLCELFDTYDIPVTWALVMHLLDDCNGHDDLVSPSFDWVDWFDAVPCGESVDKELWYAPDILKCIQSTKTDHEIALHGYSHMILGATGCSPGAARSEVETAIQTADKHGIDVDTYVFPRNKIGHLDILQESGIKFYRGVDAQWYERHLTESLRKPFRFADETFKRTPPVVTPTERDGLVELPGSQILRPYTGAWRYTPTNSQFDRAQKGIDKAAQTGKTFHLWFHPFNLGIDHERHLDLVERILSYAVDLRDAGEIEICTIAEAAQPG